MAHWLKGKSSGRTKVQVEKLSSICGCFRELPEADTSSFFFFSVFFLSFLIIIIFILLYYCINVLVHVLFLCYYYQCLHVSLLNQWKLYMSMVHVDVLRAVGDMLNPCYLQIPVDLGWI